jgi:hypothetical protein
MSIISLLIIIGLVFLAFLALKFLVGTARHIISIALFVIALAFAIYVLTGNDPFGIAHTTMDVAGKAVNTITG